VCLLDKCVGYSTLAEVQSRLLHHGYCETQVLFCSSAEVSVVARTRIALTTVNGTDAREEVKAVRRIDEEMTESDIY
jgi:hypothetical protein